MRLVKLDEKLFLKFYFYTNDKQNIKFFATYFSHLCKVLFYFLYFGLIFYLEINNKLQIKFILIPFFVYAILKIIRILVKRRRPFLVFPKLNLPKSKKYSFPSNHTGASFIISYTFLYLNIYAGIFLLLTSSLLGLSRVTIGLHFPLDIFSGFLISTFACIFFYII